LKQRALDVAVGERRYLMALGFEIELKRHFASAFASPMRRYRHLTAAGTSQHCA